MKRRREWSALLAGVMALGVLGGGISVSADEDVPTIVIYNNSGAFSVAGAEAGSDSSIYQKMQDYILEQTGVKVEIIMPPSDAGAQTEKLNPSAGRRRSDRCLVGRLERLCERRHHPSAD